MSVIPRAAPLAPLTLALLWGCAPKVPPDTAQDSRPDSTETGETAEPLAPRLLVSGYKSGAVLVLDPTTGALVTTLPGLPGAQATRVHPDGRLLLVAEEIPGVYVADATTFEGLTPLIWNDPGTPGGRDRRPHQPHGRGVLGQRRARRRRLQDRPHPAV
jgi:hypothetical protein